MGKKYKVNKCNVGYSMYYPKKILKIIKYEYGWIM
jgi:hypothetical protein